MKPTLVHPALERRSPVHDLCAGLLGLALLTALPTSGQNLNPVFVSSWPGQPAGAALSVALTGTKAIVSVGEAGLFIAEILSASQPARLTTFDTPGMAYSVAVNNTATYAYVADGEAGVHVLAITNLAKPIRVGGYDTAGSARSVALLGAYAYVADGSAGIQVLSLTNPANPVRVGGYDTTGEAVSIAAIPAPEGTRLFVADRFGGLVLLNARIPTNPTLLGVYSPGQDINGVTLDGLTAFVSAGNAGLLILSTTNAASPTLIGSLDTPGFAQGVSRASTAKLVQIADGEAGVQLIGITNLAVPVLLGAYNTTGVARGVAATPTYAYTADGDAGFQIIRISTPSAPVRMGGLATRRVSYGVAVTGDLAVLANGSYGATVLNVANPAAPVQLGSLATAGAAAGVAVAGGLACVAEGGSGVEMLSLTNPANLVRLGGYDTPSYAAGVTLDGDLACVADQEGGLQLIGITNAASPVGLGDYNTYGYAANVAVANNLAYVADSFEGLVILSLTNPAAPTLLGTYTNHVVYDVAISGNLAFLAASGSGLVVLDVSNPSNPILKSSLGDIGPVFSIALAEQYAYVGGGSEGVRVVDVSNPAAPLLVGSYNTPGQVTGLTAAGRFLYVADADWGMTILRLAGTSNAPPSITSQPVNQFGVEGGAVTFSAAATGAEPLSYQWYLGTAPLAGKTVANLSLTGLTLSQAGNYSLVVTNPLGVVTSQVATLTVLPAGSSLGWFASEDRSTVGNWKGVYGTQGQLIFGAVTNLTATVTGGAFFAFTTNTTNPSALERPGTTSVTNRFAAAQYSATSLDVNVTLPTGQTNRLAVYVMEPGGGRVERVDLIDINSGIVLDSRVISGLTNGVYLVWDVTGPVRTRFTRLVGGNALVNAVFVGTTLGQAPSLRAQPPATQFISPGGSLVLGAGADGTPALRFQWRKDGLPLTDTARRQGSASPVLTMTGVETSDTGTYTLRVTNALGQVTGATSVVSVGASARFVMQDDTTKGNWKQVYGTQGAIIYGLSTNLPAGVQCTLNGASYFGLSTNTYVPAALERTDSSSPTNRFSAVVLSGTNFTIDATLPTSTTNRLALYFMEPNGGRTQLVELLDPTSGAILDSRLVSSLTNGVYVNWDVSGPVRVRVTRVAGANAVLSGLFLGTGIGQPVVRVQPMPSVMVARGASVVLGAGFSGQPAMSYQWLKNNLPLVEAPTRQGVASPVLALSGLLATDTGSYAVRATNSLGQVTTEPAALTVLEADPAKGRFVMQDSTTLGSWKGVYGTDGYLIVGLATNLPVPAKQISLASGSYFAFATNTTAANALERTGTDSVTNRFAACQFDPTAILVNVNLPVGTTNRIALYLMEPTSIRTQRVELMDGNGIVVLDTRTVSGLSNAVYLVYDVNGPVQVRITSLAGGNCLVNAVFLGTAVDQMPVVRTQPVTNVTASIGGGLVLAAGVSGSPALTYQWLKDGLPLSDTANRSGAAKPVLSFSGMQLTDGGNYSLWITNAFGATTSLTAVVTFPPPPVWSRFVQNDATTLGNWKGVYGTLGHLIVGLSTNLPIPEQQVLLENGTTLVHSTNTPNANALERADSEAVTNRFSASQSHASALLLSVSVPTGVTNRIAFYLMEPGVTRTERFELLDAAGTNVLDSRTVSALSNAVYLVYDVSGPVKARITRLAGSDAVLSAVFLGTTMDTAPTMRTAPPATLSADAGGQLALGAGVNGSPALAYQWWKDGTALSDGPNRQGSLQPVLNLGALLPADAGSYFLVTTNTFGAVTSLTSVVSIILPPPRMLHLTLVGEPGATYLIEVSTNLTQWLPQAPPQQVVATPEGAIEIIVPDNAIEGRQFYRGLKQ
jgi:hypothetical protein